jgi:hypothetical protein
VRGYRRAMPELSLQWRGAGKTDVDETYYLLTCYVIPREVIGRC